MNWFRNWRRYRFLRSQWRTNKPGREWAKKTSLIQKVGDHYYLTVSMMGTRRYPTFRAAVEAEME